MNMDLTNKNALVCGSTQGIGKSIAVELAKMGANVILLARNEEKLKVVLNELDDSMKQLHSYACADFSDPEEVKNAIHSLLSEKNIHILINNTGGHTGGPIINSSTDNLRQHTGCTLFVIKF